MQLKKLIPALGLCAALFSFSPKANAETNINLFPNQPFSTITMTDPDIYQTKIKFPETFFSKKSLPEIASYISIAKTLPLVSLDFGFGAKKLILSLPSERREASKLEAMSQGKSLSDKTLSLSLIGNSLLETSKTGRDIDYKLKLELFARSPIIDDYLSDGNKLYIVGGYSNEGLIKINDRSLSNIDFSPTKNSFSVDAYVVPKSPYSNQYIILRVGADNLFNNTGESANMHFSASFEFPSLLDYFKIFKNFKLSPYASLYGKIPFRKELDSEACGEVGIKAWGESERAIVLYGKAHYKENKDITYSAGLKLDL